MCRSFPLSLGRGRRRAWPSPPRRFRVCRQDLPLGGEASQADLGGGGEEELVFFRLRGEELPQGVFHLLRIIDHHQGRHGARCQEFRGAQGEGEGLFMGLLLGGEGLEEAPEEGSVAGQEGVGDEVFLPSPQENQPPFPHIRRRQAVVPPYGDGHPCAAFPLLGEILGGLFPEGGSFRESGAHHEEHGAGQETLEGRPLVFRRLGHGGLHPGGGPLPRFALFQLHPSLLGGDPELCLIQVHQDWLSPPELRGIALQGEAADSPGLDLQSGASLLPAAPGLQEGLGFRPPAFRHQPSGGEGFPHPPLPNQAVMVLGGLCRKPGEGLQQGSHSLRPPQQSGRGIEAGFRTRRQERLQGTTARGGPGGRQLHPKGKVLQMGDGKLLQGEFPLLPRGKRQDGARQFQGMTADKGNPRPALPHRKYPLALCRQIVRQILQRPAPILQPDPQWAFPGGTGVGEPGHHRLSQGRLLGESGPRQDQNQGASMGIVIARGECHGGLQGHAVHRGGASKEAAGGICRPASRGGHSFPAGFPAFSASSQEERHQRHSNEQSCPEQEHEGAPPLPFFQAGGCAARCPSPAAAGTPLPFLRRATALAHFPLPLPLSLPTPGPGRLPPPPPPPPPLPPGGKAGGDCGFWKGRPGQR